MDLCMALFCVILLYSALFLDIFWLKIVFLRPATFKWSKRLPLTHAHVIDHASYFTVTAVYVYVCVCVWCVYVCVVCLCGVCGCLCVVCGLCVCGVWVVCVVCAMCVCVCGVWVVCVCVSCDRLWVSDRTCLLILDFHFNFSSHTSLLIAQHTCRT
jgi:hypothetical protein